MKKYCHETAPGVWRSLTPNRADQLLCKVITDEAGKKTVKRFERGCGIPPAKMSAPQMIKYGPRIDRRQPRPEHAVEAVESFTHETSEAGVILKSEWTVSKWDDEAIDAETKLAKIAQVKNVHDSRLKTGFEYDGGRYPATTKDQHGLGSVLSAYSNAETLALENGATKEQLPALIAADWFFFSDGQTLEITITNFRHVALAMSKLVAASFNQRREDLRTIDG